MTVTVKHSKTNAISDWTQAQLDEQIALGNFAEGTVLADIVLPSDWNNDHTLTGVGTMAEQDANSVAITGGTATLSSVTTPSVTATTNNLTLSSASTGTITINTASANNTFLLVKDDTTAAASTTGLTVLGASSGLGRLALRSNKALYVASGSSNNISFLTNSGAVSEGSTQMLVGHTASAVNYVQVTGGATTFGPTVSSQGSDSNIAIGYSAKGTGAHNFYNNSGISSRQFRIDGSVVAVNYNDFYGSTTGNAIAYKANGSDTNISMAFQPKGTGAIDLAAGSRGVNISNGGTVTAITRTVQGSGYTSVPSLAISAPTTAGGVQATATANLGVLSATIVSGGTGYTVGDTLTVVGGTGTAAQLTVSTVSTGVITAVTVAAQNGVYSVFPTSPVSVTGGTGASATFNISGGILSTFTITNAGSGYIEQPTITFSGGGGSGASAYATVGSMPIIRSLAGSAATGDSLSFYTPAGESVRIRDQGVTSNGYVQLQGSSATSNGSYVTSSAGSLYISCAGTNAIGMFTNGQGGTRQFNITHTASAVNYVQVTGAATTVTPVVSSQGSDTNIALSFQSKGSGAINFYNNGGITSRQVRIDGGVVAVNYLDLYGSTTTNAPAIKVNGTDTNIDLALTPKGTGLVRFGTYVAGALTATGYINIKAADGTTYKVLVST